MPFFEPLLTVQIANPETGESMTINESDYRPSIHVLWVEPAPKSKRKKVEEVVPSPVDMTDATEPPADE